MSAGWIILSRQILDHWMWQDEPFDKARAWIDLLFLANFEDKKSSYKGEVITCKRGDVNFSISYLADRWRWDRKTVRKFLSLLESDGMVIVNSSTHRTTITIVKYDDYQLQGTTKGTAKRTTKSQQDGQPSPTIKELKEIKEIKEKDIYGVYSHVKLTKEEFERLGSEFGEDIRDQAITFLDEYCEDKKKYKHNDDNLCIRRWVIDAVKERQKKNNPQTKKNSFNTMMERKYDFEEVERMILK